MLITRRGSALLAFLAFAVFLFTAAYLLDVPSKLQRASSPPFPSEPPIPERRLRPPSPPNEPIVDNFPAAAHALQSSDLPPIPAWNAPPIPHVTRATPLFIGFTRNWPMLQQTVVSYLTAGWPAEDIYVVENTGTMDANRRQRLTLQNPFFLDHARLTKVLGVQVLSTPTLLSFAQLQNFYLSYAIDQGWNYYFWGHMDVLALSEEGWRDAEGRYKSLYGRVLDELEVTLNPAFGKWAIRFFAYDRLALVSVDAFVDVGGWDPMIGYYMTDCDMHERLFMKNYTAIEARVGLIYDVGSSIDDLLVLYRRLPQATSADDVVDPPLLRSTTSSSAPSWSAADTQDSEHFAALIRAADDLQRQKNDDTNPFGRNYWQSRQQGGQGEPYYVNSRGFEQAIQMAIEHGRAVYSEKWGHRDCDLRNVGLKSEDAWLMEHDW